MAPPQNRRRREALADAAITILGTSGIHALSHRAVDERAGLPTGTAANYFPTRDGLLEAAAHRVVGLHVAAMKARDSQVVGPIGPSGLVDLLGDVLYDWATRQRIRCLALSGLALEATRRPALAQVLSGLTAATLHVTIGQHRDLGLATSPEQVQMLITLFSSVLLMLAAGPPEAVTPDGTRALARCLVAGVLTTVPGLAWSGS